jgi:hypothetical protein
VRHTGSPVPSPQSHLIVKCESSALSLSRMADSAKGMQVVLVSNLIRGLEEIHHLFGVDDDINGPLSIGDESARQGSGERR